MKVKIDFAEGKATKEDIMALKTFIEKKRIDGLKKVELASSKPKKGEMGPGIVSGLTALFGAVTGPLSVMAEALVEFVKLKRSEIRIMGVSGAEICISGKVKNADLHQALENFFAQEKANAKSGAKREKKGTPPPPPPNPEKQDKK